MSILLPGVNYFLAFAMVISYLIFSLAVATLMGYIGHSTANVLLPKTKAWKTMASGARDAGKYWLNNRFWAGVSFLLTTWVCLYILAGPVYWVLKNLEVL